MEAADPIRDAETIGEAEAIEAAEAIEEASTGMAVVLLAEKREM